MPDTQESPVQNTLLGSLAKPDFELLRQKLEWADLASGDVLYEVNGKVDYAYFQSPASARSLPRTHKACRLKPA
jgi:hypothetical protein